MDLIESWGAPQDDPLFSQTRRGAFWAFRRCAVASWLVALQPDNAATLAERDEISTITSEAARA